MIINNTTGDIMQGELESKLKYDYSKCSSFVNTEIRMTDLDKTDRIEQVIKALGTMVLQPEFETDPNTFQKRLVANNQVPILQGEDRTKVLNKLVELIVE